MEEKAEERRALWSSYSKIQETFHEEEEDVAAMILILLNLPNLRSIEIGEWLAGSLDSYGRRQTFMPSYGMKIIEHRTGYKNATSSRISCQSHSFHGRTDTNGLTHTLKTVLKALRVSGNHIENLSAHKWTPFPIDDGDDLEWVHADVLPSLQTQLLKGFRQAFAQLQTTGTQGFLTELFERAPQLRDLSSTSDGVINVLPLSFDFVEPSKMLSLREVELQNARIQVKDMRALLKKFAGAALHLALRYSALDGASWPDFVRKDLLPANLDLELSWLIVEQLDSNDTNTTFLRFCDDEADDPDCDRWSNRMSTSFDTRKCRHMTKVFPPRGSDEVCELRMSNVRRGYWSDDECWGAWGHGQISSQSLEQADSTNSIMDCHSIPRM
ncbi:hypothetical protein LTR37_000936 [Vermiconidia calcicola]|uniref:Uncharacterized protein n=1 Tax=Vermiconidia calcicola TaxID=1690605 RepID=A0ACC3NXM2_9PEZI|nr:hypothetical protein LTR37_000936 [Vermiconidia calcicola]